MTVYCKGGVARTPWPGRVIGHDCPAQCMFDLFERAIKSESCRHCQKEISRVVFEESLGDAYLDSQLDMCVHAPLPRRSIRRTFLQMEAIFGADTGRLGSLCLKDPWGGPLKSIPSELYFFSVTDLPTGDLFQDFLDFWIEKDESDFLLYRWLHLVFRMQNRLKKELQNPSNKPEFWEGMRRVCTGGKESGWWEQIEGIVGEDIPAQIDAWKEKSPSERNTLVKKCYAIFTDPQLINGANLAPKLFGKSWNLVIIAGLALSIFATIGVLHYYGKLDRLYKYTKNLSRKIAPSR